MRFIEARTSGLIDQILRGRVWVGIMGALLAGIVFLNVSLLELNRNIARTTTQATTLDRQTSSLRARVAALDSSMRIQRLAEARGMFMPAPDQYRYLVARPWLDSELAARRVAAPSLTSGALAAAPSSTATATPTGQAATPAAAAATSTPAASTQTAAASATATGAP